MSSLFKGPAVEIGCPFTYRPLVGNQGCPLKEFTSLTAKRERMSADARRNAILDVATRLLATHRWEDVTVARLIKGAGISKGGFYHHFGSKEDVLEAVVLRLADACTAAGQAIIERTEGGTAERFSAFLAGTARWELEHADEIMGVIRIALLPGAQSIGKTRACE